MNAWELEYRGRRLSINGDRGEVAGLRPYSVSYPGGGPPPIATANVVTRFQFHVVPFAGTPEIPLDVSVNDAKVRDGNTVTFLRACSLDAKGKKEWMPLVLVNHATRTYIRFTDCLLLVDRYLIRRSWASAFFEPLVLLFAPLVAFGLLVASSTPGRYLAIAVLVVLWALTFSINLRRREDRSSLLAQIEGMRTRAVDELLAEVV